MTTKVVKDARGASDVRLKVMAHPDRRAALMVFRLKGPISPTEVANEIGVDVSGLSYHVRILAKYGYIELVREEKVRGTLKSFYVAAERHELETEQWAAMDDVLKDSALLDGIKPILGDFNGAVRDGKFRDDDRFILARSPIRAVDQQGYEELLEAHRELIERAATIESEAATRMAESGESAVSVTSGQQCFLVDDFHAA